MCSTWNGMGFVPCPIHFVAFPPLLPSSSLPLYYIRTSSTLSDGSFKLKCLPFLLFILSPSQLNYQFISQSSPSFFSPFIMMQSIPFRVSLTHVFSCFIREVTLSMISLRSFLIHSFSFFISSFLASLTSQLHCPLLLTSFLSFLSFPLS